MIKGIGVDIVENSRLTSKLQDYNFIEHILTSAELNEFQSRKGSKKLEYLCGRFAAKEAIIKAINNYEHPSLKEIEILNNPDGSPSPHFKDYHLLVSISHEKHYAIAEAILL